MPKIYDYKKIFQAEDYDTENIFARIVRRDLPAKVIFETDMSIAIMDAFPEVPGHCLLIPKRGSRSVAESNPEDMAFLQDLPKLVRLARMATKASGVQVKSNIEKAAGQMVFHTHFHVIPVYKTGIPNKDITASFEDFLTAYSE